MQIGKAMETARELMPSGVSDEQLLRWLNALDGQIKMEIIDTHEGAEKINFAGYNGETDLDQELLVPAPYDGVYEHYLAAQMLFANGELEEYNAAAARYNESYAAYAAYYNRTHRPARAGGWRW